MSLNNISLPSRLIADLYQHALVQNTASAVPVKTSIPFLGKNGKNVLIVVDNPDVPYLPDNELELLTNILSACQLSLADVAIVNRSNQHVTLADDLFEQLKSKQVILFDVAPTAFGLPANTPFYTVVKHKFHQFVTAPSLTAIEKNKEAKKELWIALKQLFEI